MGFLYNPESIKGFYKEESDERTVEFHSWRGLTLGYNPATLPSWAIQDQGFESDVYCDGGVFIGYVDPYGPEHYYETLVDGQDWSNCAVVFNPEIMTLAEIVATYDSHRYGLMGVIEIQHKVFEWGTFTYSEENAGYMAQFPSGHGLEVLSGRFYYRQYGFDLFNRTTGYSGWCYVMDSRRLMFTNDFVAGVPITVQPIIARGCGGARNKLLDNATDIDIRAYYNPDVMRKYKYKFDW